MTMWDRFIGDINPESGVRIQIAALTLVMIDLSYTGGTTVPDAKSRLGLDAAEQIEFDDLVAAATSTGMSVLDRRLFALALSHLAAGSEPGVTFPGGEKPYPTGADVKQRAGEIINDLGGDATSLGVPPA